MFDTFQPKLKEGKVISGLTTNIQTYNPVKIAFFEWVAIFKDTFYANTSFINRIKYFIKPLG